MHEAVSSDGLSGRDLIWYEALGQGYYFLRMRSKSEFRPTLKENFWQILLARVRQRLEKAADGTGYGNGV